MVKTKRSTARTAVLASASLLLAARGADAAIGFTAGAGATDAFVTGGTVDCANLWFVDSTGVLTYGDNGNGNTATHSQGLAVNKAGLTGAPASFSDCKVAPGYYLSVVATSASDGDNLKILPTPANFFSAASSTVEVLTYASTPGTWDGSTATALAGTGVTKCPFGGTTLTTARSALTDCAPDCVTTNTNSGAVANGGTCECAANYYGSPLDAGGVTTAAASTGCTACSAGTTSTAGTTASSGCTGASPTAASPTAADSAGASTPIAVALAAAAAVPLLL